VEWHVADRTLLRPVETGVQLLAEVRAMHPGEFAWRREAYEFVSDVPAIDLLTGSDRARAVIEGRADASGLFGAWASYCEGFREDRRGFLLYPETG
jgi:uncharacterized protein YbbC (DUF1343 family)